MILIQGNEKMERLNLSVYMQRQIRLIYNNIRTINTKIIWINTHYYTMWSQQEQILLKYLKEEKQMKSWVAISQSISKQFPSKIKTPKQCRQKYINYVSFSDKDSLNQQWSVLQLTLLYQQYLEYGPQWKAIKLQFPNRSQNGIKNKFNCSVRKFINRINVSKRKKITFNSIMKLLNIFQKPQELKEIHKRLLKYKEFRLELLSLILLPQKILNTSEIQAIHETTKAFNIESKCLNSSLGRNRCFEKNKKVKNQEFHTLGFSKSVSSHQILIDEISSLIEPILTPKQTILTKYSIKEGYCMEDLKSSQQIGENLDAECILKDYFTNDFADKSFEPQEFMNYDLNPSIEYFLPQCFN